MPYKNKEDRHNSDQRYDAKNREKRREQTRLAAVKLYAKRKREGLCVHCGKVARPDTTQCQECFEQRYARLKKNRQARKRKAVQYLGGKCADCGLQINFMSVYDFHHKDANSKEDGIAGLLGHFKTWKKIQGELDKCVLLCSNCHRIRHELEDNGPP